MSKLRRKMTPEEMALYRKFKIRGGHNLQRVKLNVPDLESGNTWRHEVQKLRQAWLCSREGHAWIMEACEIKTNRNRDLTCLTCKIIWEYETDKNRTKKEKEAGKYESPNMIVEIVKLWAD